MSLSQKASAPTPATPATLAPQTRAHLALDRIEEEVEVLLDQSQDQEHLREEMEHVTVATLHHRHVLLLDDRQPVAGLRHILAPHQDKMDQPRPGAAQDQPPTAPCPGLAHHLLNATFVDKVVQFPARHLCVEEGIQTTHHLLFELLGVSHVVHQSQSHVHGRDHHRLEIFEEQRTESPAVLHDGMHGGIAVLPATVTCLRRHHVTGFKEREETQMSEWMLTTRQEGVRTIRVETRPII